MKLLKLDLLQNSHAFLREAADNAVCAQDELAKWQFAILHICQSVELTVKAILHKTHPVFVFEDIDKRKHTVSLNTALARLQTPEICGIELPERDAQRIRVIAALRNDITHSTFDMNAISAEAQFFGVFAFVAYLQSRYLETEIDSVLSADSLEAISEIKTAIVELSEKAAARISDEGRNDKSVWGCPKCGEDTFVVEDSIDTCYTCRHHEPTTECPECGEIHFASEMVSLTDEFDWDYCEGRCELINDYGYAHHNVCPKCHRRISDEIEQKRQEAYYEEMQ